MTPLIPLAMELARYAPQIIGWLSGSKKAEEAAGQVVAIAESLTGAQGNEALAAISADPNLAMQFRQAMLNHKQAMDAMFLDDRKDARQMQVQTRSWTPPVLAAVVTVGFFGVLWLMLNQGLPEAGRDALLIMLGSLGTAWTAIIGYYFGSSAGSARKDELMAKGSQG